MKLLLDLLAFEKLSDKLGPAIKRQRLRKGMTLEDVASKVGVSKATISKIENAKQGLTVNSIDRIAEAMGVHALDIYQEADRGGIEPGPDMQGTVPLISWVQAGAWSEAIDNLQPGQGERIPTTYKARPHTFALRVRNDSMEPMFPSGCVIIVEPDEEATPGKYVIVRQNGGEATFKQLMKDGETLYLKPLNPRYPIMALAPDATICGVVKKMQMDV